MSEESEKTNVNFSKPMKFFIMLIVVIFAFFSVINIFYNKDNEYGDVVENFHDGLESKNLEKIMNSFLTSDRIKEEKEKEYQDIIDMLSKYFGDDYGVSYHILNEETLTKNELGSLEKDLKTNYGVYVSIKKGYRVKLETTIKKEGLQSVTTTALKMGYVGFKWYIIP